VGHTSPNFRKNRAEPPLLLRLGLKTDELASTASITCKSNVVWKYRLDAYTTGVPHISYILVGTEKNNLPNTRLPTCMTFENRTLPVSCFSDDATKLLESACPKPTRPRRSSEYETSAPSWCTMNRWNGLCETVSMA
jgi:hypothetical protein